MNSATKTPYRRIPHAGHYDGAGARLGHDLEQWDAVQEWAAPRPADVPHDAEKHHGYLDKDGNAHTVFVRTAELTPGTCPNCPRSRS